MAAVVRCLKCKKYLREHGDISKMHVNEYIVYDSLWNTKMKAGEKRILECLACGHFGKLDYEGNLT